MGSTGLWCAGHWVSSWGRTGQLYKRSMQIGLHHCVEPKEGAGGYPLGMNLRGFGKVICLLMRDLLFLVGKYHFLPFKGQISLIPLKLTDPCLSWVRFLCGQVWMNLAKHRLKLTFQIGLGLANREKGKKGTYWMPRTVPGIVVGFLCLIY